MCEMNDILPSLKGSPVLLKLAHRLETYLHNKFNEHRLKKEIEADFDSDGLDPGDWKKSLDGYSEMFFLPQAAYDEVVQILKKMSAKLRDWLRVPSNEKKWIAWESQLRSNSVDKKVTDSINASIDEVLKDAFSAIRNDLMLQNTPLGPASEVAKKAGEKAGEVLTKLMVSSRFAAFQLTVKARIYKKQLAGATCSVAALYTGAAESPRSGLPPRWLDSRLPRASLGSSLPMARATLPRASDGALVPRAAGSPAWARVSGGAPRPSALPSLLRGPRGSCGSLQPRAGLAPRAGLVCPI